MLVIAAVPNKKDSFEIPRYNSIKQKRGISLIIILQYPINALPVKKPIKFLPLIFIDLGRLISERIEFK